MPKRLRNDLGGALKEFTKRESHCFAQVTDGEGIYALFTSQERQWLVLQVLQSLRAGVDDLKALNGIAQIEEGQSIGKIILKSHNFIFIFEFLFLFSCCLARIGPY